MKLKGLDDIDQQILELLSNKARMSYVDIGNHVNLSRVAVRMRIQSLENSGVIEGYCTIINPQKIGNSVSSFFDLEIEPKHLQSGIKKLYDNPHVTQIYQMTGSSNLHVHTVMDSDEMLESFLKNTIYALPGIKNVECNMIISRIKDYKGIRL